MNKSRTDYLHLFVLVTFAVAQPLYDILGQNPAFFVAHKAGPVLITTLVLSLSIGLPLLFVLVELFARIFSRRSQRVVHSALVLFLIALIGAPVAKQPAGDNDLIMTGLVLAVALLFTVLYVRLNSIRMFITALLPIIFIAPLWFIWGTPVAGLVKPQTMETHTDIQIKNKVPVVVVVFDELSITALLDSQERIDSVRFPNFAAFAAESFWFPNAVAAAEHTEIAVPSILTGLNPRPKQRLAPTITDYPNNLFTMLHDQYSFNISEVMTRLSPNEITTEKNWMEVNRYAALFSDIAVIYLHLVMPPRVGGKLPKLDARWTGFGQDLFSVSDVIKEETNPSLQKTTRSSQQAQFLSKIKASPTIGLHFIHTEMPHIPYKYLASGQRYLGENMFPEGIVSDHGAGDGWSREESLIITAYHRYLQQIGHIDIFLGNLKNRLISAGIYDKSIIIITADHGVAFQPGQSRRRITDSNANEILKIPMLIKLPGQKEAHVDERLVSSIDVLPTIIDVLGAKIPWKLDGYSVFSNQQPLRKGIDFGCFRKSNKYNTKCKSANEFRVRADDIRKFSRLKWQTENFGERTPLNNIVPKGPYHELARSDLENFRISKAVDMLLVSNDFRNFRYIDMESGFLPALFRGYIEGSNDRKLPLAIAVNGKIWATINTSEWARQKNYFSVLLPSDAFKQGQNIIDAYLINHSGDTLLLLPSKKDHQPNVTLQLKQSGAEALIFANGSEVLIDTHPNNMSGSLDKLSLEDNLLIFEGWAGDLVEGKPASNLLIFNGGKLAWQVVPTIIRPDVAESLDRPTLLNSGFYAGIPLGILEPRSDDISLIAISKDKRAFKLHIKNDFKELIRTTLAK
jgi:sulfatase-like protein